MVKEKKVSWVFNKQTKMFLQTICGLRPEPFFSKVILRIRNKCCVLQRKVQTFCSDPRSQSQYHLTGTLWSVSVSLKKFLSFFLL